MRVGQNPSKMRGSPAYQPKKVGLATLTYVPALEGYFREAREVIAVHLASLRASLGDLAAECELCVFDNGSCPEVLDFLQDRWLTGVIDYLFLSHHNLGKNGALNWIFSSMPNNYIGYSDSDVLFRKGWLENTLAIFSAFERAGMVSAQPVFFDFLRGMGTTAADIAINYTVETVQPRPEVVEEYCDGINATKEQRQLFRQTLLPVAVNRENGVRAVTLATDMQFMLPRTVARRLVPMPVAGALTARDAIEIPRGIEALGYWILSCEEPLVRHMGNTILGRGIPEIDFYLGGIITRDEAPTPEKSIGPRRQKIHPGDYGVLDRHGVLYRPRSIGRKKRTLARLQAWVDRSPRLRRWLTRLYDNLFSLLYEERTFHQ